MSSNNNSVIKRPTQYLTLILYADYSELSLISFSRPTSDSPNLLVATLRYHETNFKYQCSLL